MKAKRQLIIVAPDKKRVEKVKTVLGNLYDYLEAFLVKDVISTLESSETDVVGVIIFHFVPRIDALDYLAKLANINVPVIVIRDRYDLELVAESYKLGAADCIRDDFDDLTLSVRINNVLSLRLAQKELSQVQAKLREKEEEQKETGAVQEAQMRRILYRDQLTGALNMHGFRIRAKELLEQYPDKPYALWYTDIRNFKFVNVNYGFSEGDNLLRFWAKLMLNTLSTEEALACVSGDRFVALVEIANKEQLAKLDKNFDEVRNYLIDKGSQHKIQIYSGVYILTQGDYQPIDIDRMIACAGIAQKNIKNNSAETFAVYNPNQWEAHRRNMLICNDLNNAIKNGEIKVYFQPQYNFSKKALAGAEALCRWFHHSLGFISPGEFVQVLEESGQIFDLDYFVWEEACRNLRKWEDQGVYMTASVNVDRKDIVKERDLTKIFQDLLKKIFINRRKITY